MYLINSITNTMSVYKMGVAKYNLKTFRVKAYLNVTTPALANLLAKTDLKALDQSTKKTLVNHLT